MAREAKPTLYVLAGPEGAGKSTFHQTTLKSFTRAELVSADKAQEALLGSNKQNAAHVGNLVAHQQARELLPSRRDFVYETTLADRRDVQLISNAKDQGYRVVLFHLQTRSAELSLARVAERVKEGGRDVAESTVRGDYARAPSLIRESAQQADLSFVYDTSALNQAPAHVLSLERGRVTKSAEQLPQWARDTYARELTRATPEQQSAAAASFYEARTIVQRLAGPDARLGIAGHQPGSTRGVLAAESQHHLVQKVGDKEYVAHFKDRLAVRPGLFNDVKIAYGANRDRGAVEFGADRGARTAAMNRAEARAYLTEPRETAQKDYPGLAGAYAAEDALKGVAARARPSNVTVNNKVSEVIRQTIASRIQNGQAITVDRPMADAVKHQVASRSLDLAVADKLVHPEKQIKIDPLHRELLVSRSDAVVRAVEGRVTAMEPRPKGMDEAKDIANRLARLDGPRAQNPFASKALGAEYEKVQKQQQDGPERALRAAQKGMDR